MIGQLIVGYLHRRQIANTRIGHLCAREQHCPIAIADGLLTSLGTKTFPVIQDCVEQIVTVSEVAIIESMKFIWESAKIIIEPSSAVAIGVLWEKKIDLRGLKVGVILSGGNVDLEGLPWQTQSK